MYKLLNITDLQKLLNLSNKNNKKISNHTLRFWEKEFSQIKPKTINKRRYYDNNQIELIKLITFLIRERGFTLKGVKKILNSNLKKLDDYNSYSLKADYQKYKIKKKTKDVLLKVKNLKRYGKKNSY